MVATTGDVHSWDFARNRGAAARMPLGPRPLGRGREWLLADGEAAFGERSMTGQNAPMSVRETLEEFSFFDQAIVEHGFTRYNRDYRLVAEIFGVTEDGTRSRLYSTYAFLFRGCVEAVYASVMRSGFP